MDLTTLIGPAVVAALVSGVVTVAGSILSARTTRALHVEKLGFDERLAEKKVLGDLSLAERKFELDKKTALNARQTALAENALIGFYEARSIFATARVPWARPGEGLSRLENQEDPDSQNSYKNAIYAPLERLNKHMDALNTLNSLRFRFAANFGQEAEEHFQAIVSAYNSVQHATHALLNDRADRSRQFTEKYEARIGWIGEDDDEIADKIQTAVTAIEAICAPVLRHQ